MPEDWNTVDAKRTARDLEILRQRYRNHREALSRLNGDAPTEALATEYARLMSEIDRALEKLNELDRDGGALPNLEATQIHEPRITGSRPSMAGERVLAASNAPTLADSATRPRTYDQPLGRQSNMPRLLLMAVVGVAVLAVLYFLVTRASTHKNSDRIVESDTAASSTTRTETQAPLVADTAPAVPASPLSAKPGVLDYGIIRKGTRKVLQVDVLNNGATAVPIVVARSTCKCLFYEYGKDVPPKGKTTVTVAVDGGRAKAGALEETIAVTSKGDPNLATSFTVKATIK
jgi:Protein of unknown function (DUF1573)